MIKVKSLPKKLFFFLNETKKKKKKKKINFNATFYLIFLLKIFSFIFGCPSAYGVSGPRITSEQHLQPMPPLWQCQIFYPTVLGQGSNLHSGAAEMLPIPFLPHQQLLMQHFNQSKLMQKTNYQDFK